MKPRSRSVPVPGKLRSKGRKRFGYVAPLYVQAMREGEIKGLLRAARRNSAGNELRAWCRSEASRLRKVGR